MDFREPIHVGELVSFLASVNYTGTSSMEIGIKVLAENIRTQESRHVNSCYFTMVAVGDDSKPVAVPPLRPFTPDEKRRWDGAVLRKQPAGPVLPSAHAIDRESIVKNIVGAGSRVLHTQCFPSQFGCTDQGAARYAYDPALAKKLLAEAGYPDGFKVSLREIGRAHV